MSVGGSLETLTLNGRNFSITSDSDSPRKLGGFENEVLANGDGSARVIKTRVPLSITDLVIQIDDARGDHEFLQELANLSDFFTIALSYASGITWQGSAQITGEIPMNNMSTTASISLGGPGVLTKQ